MESLQTGLLLIAAAQGILLGFTMLLPGKRKHPSGAYLGIIILVLAIELLNVWGMRTGYHHSPQVVPFWLLGSYLWMPAAAYLFMKQNMEPAFRLEKKYLLLFLPAIVEIVTETVAYIYNQSAASPVSLLRIRAWWLATEIVPAMWMAGVLVWSGRGLARKARQEKTAAAFTGIHPARLLSIYLLLALLTILWIADAVLLWPVFEAVALLIVLVLFTLSFLAYTQHALLDVAPVMKTKPPVQPVFNGYNDQQEWRRLQQVFEQVGLHKRSKLTLEELSKELDLPSRYVSHLINTYHGSNFHQFINTWRVQEVIRKMGDPGEQHKTLLALALESGFSSKSSFQQVFKLHTGQSPSQYHRQ